MFRCRQLGLLLWKNYVLQKRKIFVTVIEIGLPAFFAFVLIAIRGIVHANEVYNVTHWTEFEVDHLPESLCPDSFTCNWRLYYAPNTTATQRIMEKVQAQLSSDVTGMIYLYINYK